MVQRRSTRAAVVAVVLGVLATGCCITRHWRGPCTSRERATEIDAELRERNIVRAELVMRAVAEQRGAELLPDRVQEMGFVALCDAQTRSACVDLGGGAGDDRGPRLLTANGGVLRLVAPNGSERLVISLDDSTSDTARLARRGSRLFLLVPEVTPHRKGRRAQCECDGGPQIMSMSGYVNVGRAFVLDGVQDVEIERVTVPVTEDYIEWKCRVFLV